VAVVALGSVRSCGVTTLTLALAATWPADRRVLLVELDPAGGTLAGASGWPVEPGLVSLAAAARRGGDPELVWGHCQQLPGGAAALAEPPAADHARSALGMLSGLLGRLAELDADVLVDLGRLDAGSPMLPLLEGADRVVLATRPRLADLHAVAIWLEARPPDAKRLEVVAVGDGPYPDREIIDALGVDVLARLPWDPGAADLLVSLPASARELRVAPLVRAARTLADRLTGETEGKSASADGSTDGATGGSSVRLRRRVLRGWRPATLGHSTNGSAPEEMSP
jgi:hypothetical protein